MRSLLLALLLCGTVAAQTPAVRYVQPDLIVAEGAKRTHGFVMPLANFTPRYCRIDICEGGGTLLIAGVPIDPVNVWFVGSALSVYFGGDFPPGPSDIELRVPGITIRAPGTITFVSDADFETILLPHIPGDPLPGANGSMWRVEMFVRNDSPHSLKFDLPMFGYTLVSPPPPDWFIVPPQTTAEVATYSLNGPARMRLPAIAAASIVFATRLWDESRATENFGTRIPTVRERDFRRGAITIPGVPMGTVFRNTVRVFSPDGERHQFRVRVLTHATLPAAAWGPYPPHEPVIAEVLATYTVSAEANDPADKSGFPWSVPMASIPIPYFPGNTKVQVQIDVVDDERAAYWAYVSVTNNETQQVTLLTP